SRQDIKAIKKDQRKQLDERQVPLIVQYSQQKDPDTYRKVVPTKIVHDMTLNVSGVKHDGSTPWPPNLVTLDENKYVTGIKWTNPKSKEEAGLGKYIKEEYFGYQIKAKSVYKI
ncbi:hypothetical protein HDV02_004060, partial [Globomyces sp. JEL0801]